MSSAAWPDDRVEMVQKLWEAGLSASQIAAEVCRSPFEKLPYVTRNAVIGIIHRRGWGGRTKRPSSSAPRQRKVKPVQFAFRARSLRGENFKSPTLAPDHPLDAIGQELESEVYVPPAAAACTLLELTDDTCKWPVGDPQQPDFHFCGGMALRGLPYCAGHSRVAYQPSAPRRMNLSPQEHARRVAQGIALAAANRARRAAEG